MDGSVYPDKDVIKASRNTVMLYASKESTHGEGEKQQGKEKVTSCNAEFGIRCEQHVELFQQTSQLFFDGTIRMPTHILLMPDGTEIKRHIGAMNSKEFIAFMNEGIKKVGAGLGRDEYLFAKGRLETGDKALEAGDLKAAAKAADEIKKNKAFKNHPAWIEKADALLGRVNDAGAERVKKAAESAAAGNVEEAKKILKDVITACGSMECGKAAREELAKLPK